MKPAIALGAALLSLGLAVPASASLAVGAKAPDFTTRGVQDGKQMDVKLSKLLKKGPVVLYFFPAAFTKGCTMESHDFAESVEKFKAAGATVLGMSADPVEKLVDFSTKECGSKFPMASAGPAIIKDFDVAFPPRAGVPIERTAGLTDRTSYVIDRKGMITYAFTEQNPGNHVKNTLAAVEALKAKKGG